MKDSVDVKSPRTSFGRQAYYYLYPPRSGAVESIQRMMECGGVVYRKAKMSSFSNWEEPVEYIDHESHETCMGININP